MQMNHFWNPVRVSLVSGVTSGLALLLLAAPAGAGDPTRIGVVDMQHALQTVTTGKEAKAKFEKYLGARNKEVQEEQAEIKKQGEEFKKKSLAMSEKARSQKQNDLQERIMKFQEMAAKAQNEIQQKEADLTQPIINSLRVVIEKEAKKRGYEFVFEKNQNVVLYSDPKADLTTDVIVEFDKENKSESKS